MGTLRDASELLWPAVAETLATLDLSSEHAAAAKLARRYAQVIDSMPDHAPRGAPDQAWAMRWIGPLLLDALEALGATPRARAAQKVKGTQDKPRARSQLEILREQRTRGRA